MKNDVPVLASVTMEAGVIITGANMAVIEDPAVWLSTPGRMAPDNWRGGVLPKEGDNIVVPRDGLPYVAGWEHRHGRTDDEWK